MRHEVGAVRLVRLHRVLPRSLDLCTRLLINNLFWLDCQSIYVIRIRLPDEFRMESIKNRFDMAMVMRIIQRKRNKVKLRHLICSSCYYFINRRRNLELGT